MKKIVLVVSILLLSLSVSKAQEAPSIMELEYNSIIETAPNPENIVAFSDFISQGVKFIYLGEKNSVDHWLSVQNGGMQIVSTTIDGKALIFGSIYDSKGNDIVLDAITEVFPNMGEVLYMHSKKNLRDTIDMELEYFKQSAEIEQSKPKSDVPVDQLMWQSLEETYYIEKGNPIAPTVYVFTDIFCGHCEELENGLQQYIDRSLVNVRYIPIGVLSEDSVLAAIGIMSSADPKLAWDDYYDNKNYQVLKTTPTEEGISRIEKNTLTFEKWKLRGTPSIFYKAKSGEVKFIYGQPSSIEELVNDTSK